MESGMPNENVFQSRLIKELKTSFPGSLVFKMDPKDHPGIPDLLILYKDKWASLECKKQANSSKRSGQPYYVAKMNEMSYSAFVSPENKKEVLDDLRRVFGT